MLVHQHRQAEPADFGDPGRGIRIVFMIAGDEISAVARFQIGQRRGVRRKLHDAAIDQVARHGDHVRIQRIDHVYDGLQVAALDRRSDMDVA